MKKILLFLTLVLCLTSCKDDDKDIVTYSYYYWNSSLSQPVVNYVGIIKCVPYNVKVDITMDISHSGGFDMYSNVYQELKRGGRDICYYNADIVAYEDYLNFSLASTYPAYFKKVKVTKIE